jgi:carbon storage regulator CsrA
MLVLSRKEGEEILIGDNIRVQVLAIRGNTVRLGFVAPQQTVILRNELGPLEGEPSDRVRPSVAERKKRTRHLMAGRRLRLTGPANPS